MSDKKQEELKRRIVQFVNHTQLGCERQVCFGHYCMKNPDNSKLQKAESVKLAIQLVKNEDLRFCENDGIIQPF
jgi:hypothetical protein